MQLYYMKKDGNKISSVSVVLMAVAVIYKFVLALIGIGIMFFWRAPLKEYLKGYYWMYFLGLFLNITVGVSIAFGHVFSWNHSENFLQNRKNSDMLQSLDEVRFEKRWINSYLNIRKQLAFCGGIKK